MDEVMFVNLWDLGKALRPEGLSATRKHFGISPCYFFFQFPAELECPQEWPISTAGMRQMCAFQRERVLLSHAIPGELTNRFVTHFFLLLVLILDLGRHQVLGRVMLLLTSPGWGGVCELHHGAPACLLGHEISVGLLCSVTS